MIKYEVGMLVRSKSGHDKGKLYVISQVEKDYIYIVDGTYRTLEKPKKKRKMHVQVINQIPQIILTKIKAGAAINNEDIKRVIGG